MIAESFSAPIIKIFFFIPDSINAFAMAKAYIKPVHAAEISKAVAFLIPNFAEIVAAVEGIQK
ncbi:hypothetical protein D3C81_2297450 [compost metagenome]